MGIRWEDAVLFQPGKKPGEPTLITVNCPDKAGLGCDLCRIILEFGLCITRGDFQTDGKWCYIVLWTVPQASSSTTVEWDSLKHRLQAACPSWSIMSSFHFNQPSSPFAKPSPVYLLKVFSLDRKGLLHDVTKVLSKLELTIQRVKVTTTPDDKVLDLFFITDTMDLLHTKDRRDETCRHLTDVLKEHCISCELQLSGPEFENQQGGLSFSSEVAEQLFSCKLSNKEVGSLPLSSEMKKVKKASIAVDNNMSPSHTLLQIQCIDQKSLVYDILRTSKDFDIQIAYGRISPTVDGCRNVDLFIQKKDGGKIVDPEILTALCSHLKEEMLHPLRVTIASRGPDTILLVANPVEVSGFGRPRVFYDVTLALKLLGICIFSAEVVRHSTSDRKWEVYRFLLDDSPIFSIASQRTRVEIVDEVRKILMRC